MLCSQMLTDPIREAEIFSLRCILFKKNLYRYRTILFEMIKNIFNCFLFDFQYSETVGLVKYTVLLVHKVNYNLITILSYFLIEVTEFILIFDFFCEISYY